MLELCTFILDQVFKTLAIHWMGIIWIFIYFAWSVWSCLCGSWGYLKGFRKGELFCYQIAVPSLLTFVVCGICFALSVGLPEQSGTVSSIIAWLKRETNVTIIYGWFAAFALLSHFTAYEVQEVRCKEVVKMTGKVNEISESIGDGLNIQKEMSDKLDRISGNMNGAQKKVMDLQNNMSKTLDEIQSMMKKRSQVGYTATCIPIRYDYVKACFILLLIKNKSHSKSQWMFPGGHLEVSDNRMDADFELQNVGITPDKVIRNKLMNEAGLTDIELLDPYYKTASMEPGTSGKERSYPYTCYPAEAPVFNYLFRVSESASCYKSKNHRCHYDFTYIGEYTVINNTENQYTFIEAEFPKEKIFGASSHSQAIGIISAGLVEQINREFPKKTEVKGKKMRPTTIPAEELFLDSIPEMIYSAILFYDDYRRIPDQKTDSSL